MLTSCANALYHRVMQSFGRNAQKVNFNCRHSDVSIHWKKVRTSDVVVLATPVAWCNDCHCYLPAHEPAADRAVVLAFEEMGRHEKNVYQNSTNRS